MSIRNNVTMRYVAPIIGATYRVVALPRTLSWLLQCNNEVRGTHEQVAKLFRWWLAGAALTFFLFPFYEIFYHLKYGRFNPSELSVAISGLGYFLSFLVWVLGIILLAKLGGFIEGILEDDEEKIFQSLAWVLLSFSVLCSFPILKFAPFSAGLTNVGFAVAIALFGGSLLFFATCGDAFWDWGDSGQMTFFGAGVLFFLVAAGFLARGLWIIL